MGCLCAPSLEQLYPAGLCIFLKGKQCVSTRALCSTTVSCHGPHGDTSGSGRCSRDCGPGSFQGPAGFHAPVFLQQTPCRLAPVQMRKDLELWWVARTLFWAGPARGLEGAQEVEAVAIESGLCPLWPGRTRVCGRAGGTARVNVIMSVDYFKPPGGKIQYK